MKPNIHPKYGQTDVTCACGNTWMTGSVQEHISVDVCNKCHPFFTGQQRIVDTLGRVERMRARYSKDTKT
jgi:large subunit ribosomal protein L31|tara:strand:+ start:64 stop:273 length:210 start_codon:yes stop_codon:yes gene_type:complete